MAVPQAREILDQVFNVFSDLREHRRHEIIKAVIERLMKEGLLSQEDLESRIKSGAIRIDNRISWAITFLSKARLISQTGRGVYSLSERGKEALGKGIHVNLDYLMQFREFSDWYKPQASYEVQIQSDLTPEEQMEKAYEELNRALKEELIGKLKSMESYTFERVVSELLKKMGYGEPVITSKSRDGGIDATIKADRLGLDEIHIQAKRWDSQKVGASTIREFVGSLTLRGASMGVFITTSSFTEDAKREIERARSGGIRIALIDGERLAELMIEHGVGVYTRYTYEIKAIDENFFEEV